MGNGTAVQGAPAERDSEPAVRGAAGDRDAVHATVDDLGLPEGVQFLELDTASANRLQERLLGITGLFESRQDGVLRLAALVMSPKNILLTIGDDALLVAENVARGGYVTCHIVIFNKRRWGKLDESIAAAIRWLFRNFRPAYVAAWVPAFNVAASRLVQRLGFSLDGVVRGIMVHSGRRVDAHVYSLSLEEALR